MNSKKCIIAVFVGAIIVFVWLNISWMAIEWHGIKHVKDEAATGAALKAAAADDGVYAIPSWKDADGKMLQPEEVAKAAEADPFAFMVVLPQGKTMSMSRAMIVGFVIQIVGAFILCFLMLLASGGAGSDFKRRVIAAICFGLAVGLLPALSNWNWWHFPIGYTVATILDALIGWTVAGLAMAKILEVKQPAVATTA